jgi:hypothetical protein
MRPKAADSQANGANWSRRVRRAWLPKTRKARGASALSPRRIMRDQKRVAAKRCDPEKDYFLRWRIFARMRRFLRPSFRRPLPDFLVPNAYSDFKFPGNQPTTTNWLL